MRCIGIDLGTRRIGLAFGDELGVATPLPALTQADPAQRWAALLALARERRATDLVIGHPPNMDDTVGPKASPSQARGAFFSERVGIWVQAQKRGDGGIKVHHLTGHDRSARAATPSSLSAPPSSLANSSQTSHGLTIRAF